MCRSSSDLFNKLSKIKIAVRKKMVINNNIRTNISVTVETRGRNSSRFLFWQLLNP